MSQLVAKAWADESFKQRLLADPVAVLKAEGLELPAGLTVKVLENTDKVFHLVLPPNPPSCLMTAWIVSAAASACAPFFASATTPTT